MASVGSSPLQHNDQEDVDFFDQLVDDLQNENSVLGSEHLDLSNRLKVDVYTASNRRDVPAVWTDENGDSFARLSIDGEGSAASTFQAVSDVPRVADNVFWPENTHERNDSASHESLTEPPSICPPKQSVDAADFSPRSNDATTSSPENSGPLNFGLSDGFGSSMEGSRKLESDSLSNTFLSSPSASGEIGSTHVCGMEDVTEADKVVQKEEFTFGDGMDTAVEVPVEKHLKVSGAVGKESQDKTQPIYKELQWSYFTDKCTSEEEVNNAFGAFPELVSDLGGSYPFLDSGGKVDDISLFDLSHPTTESSITTHHVQTGTLGNLGFEELDGSISGETRRQGAPYSGIREPADQVHGGGLQFEEKWHGTFREGQLGLVREANDQFSELGPGREGQAQLQEHNLVGYNATEAESQQASYEQSWENQYPGWFYDYTSNEWRKIEGYDTKVGYSSTSVVDENQVSMLSTLHEQSVSKDLHTNGTVDTSYEHHSHAVHYSNQSRWSAAYEGIGLSSQAAMESTERIHVNNQQGQAVAQGSATQQQACWEQEYPGWYYDYQAQKWGQIGNVSYGWESEQAINNSQVWQPGVDPSSYTDNQINVSKQGAQQGQGSGNQIHSFGFFPELQGNLMGQESQSSQQDVFNEATGNLDKSSEYRLGSSQAYDGGSSVNARMSGSATGSWNNSQMTPLDSSQHQSLNTDPTLQGGRFENNRFRQLGLQGDSGLNRQYYNAYQMDYAQVVSQASHNNPQQASEHFLKTYQNAQATIASRTSMEALRSSAGRPPHALAAFGFGGKFVMMKLRDTTDGDQAMANRQAWILGPAVVHNLSELVVENADIRGGVNGHSYFTSLNQAFSSPLVGGGVTTKELFKWIDERVPNSEVLEPDCNESEVLRVLWRLLKIACQHYGKLRSLPGSAGISSQADDGPEVALGKLLSSLKSQSPWNKGFHAVPTLLQSVPSEDQLQATAIEIKNLLVSGKRKEALHQAQQGQLWGPALILARQFGEKCYADTVSQMVQQQFVPGSPLRTLCLLLAGQTTEIFSTENMLYSAPAVGAYLAGANNYDQGGSGGGGMLDDWPNNLAIIAANRTKGDEQIIMHLGDCLWKNLGEVVAAHICYLVAELHFDSFSGSARLCLVGSDHFKYPRTFVSPEAIQRTELYEYAKGLGNPQFILLPFQPYKLAYANMLAEAGKVSEALRYCQAVAKTLKNAGRAPEVESCRQAATALEERLRLHSQGGYSLNLAPGKLVGRFLSTIDSTIHKIIGGPPLMQTPEPQKNTSLVSHIDSYSNSHRTDTFAQTNPSPLVPSASMEPISNLLNGYGQVEMPPRSISEPDFSKNAKKELSPSISSDSRSSAPKQSKADQSGGGYFGLGSKFLSKAVGLIRQNKKEAKLGDKNKFYYNEQLKRWVEEGAESTSEEVALPPPPTTAKFAPNLASAVSEPGSEAQVSSVAGNGSISSGMPPVPPSVNQFSTRGRLQGVRSRYVDTFNKGGSLATPPKPIQSPIVPSAGLGLTSQPAKFFVPAPPLPSFAPDNTHQLVDDGRFHEGMAGLASNGSLDAVQNGRKEAEYQPLVPKDLSSSFMAVSPIHRRSSADNVAEYVSNGYPTSNVLTSGTYGENTENGNVTDGNMSRAASWGGYPSSFQQSDEPAAAKTTGGSVVVHRSVSPNSGSTQTIFSSPVMNIETSKCFTSKGPFYTSLPSPPVIEPPQSFMGMGDTLVAEASAGCNLPQTGFGPPNSGPSGIYGDMQEVEL